MMSFFTLKRLDGSPRYTNADAIECFEPSVLSPGHTEIQLGDGKNVFVLDSCEALLRACPKFLTMKRPDGKNRYVNPDTVADIVIDGNKIGLTFMSGHCLECIGDLSSVASAFGLNQ